MSISGFGKIIQWRLNLINCHAYLKSALQLNSHCELIAQAAAAALVLVPSHYHQINQSILFINLNAENGRHHCAQQLPRKPQTMTHLSYAQSPPIDECVWWPPTSAPLHIVDWSLQTSNKSKLIDRQPSPHRLCAPLHGPNRREIRNSLPAFRRHWDLYELMRWRCYLPDAGR